MAKERHYFDYAAATPVDPAVEKVMKPYWAGIFGNPGAIHQFGQKASAAVFKSRDSISKALGCSYKEIIFTGSATEANNLALRGILKTFQQFSTGTAVLSLRRRGPATPRSDFLSSAKPSKSELRSFRAKTAGTFLPKIIVSSIEHESVLETARDLEKEGAEVVHLPVSKKGTVNLKALERALDSRTVLVSVMYANNEVGTVQPIAKISEIIRNFRNVKCPVKDEACQKRQMSNVKCSEAAYPLLHTDAVQAFNYLPCRVDKLGVDLMTLSAQKIYGPKGIGLLYMRQNHESRIKNQEKGSPIIPDSKFIIRPIITGGGQEFGLRSGTENVPGIVGFAKAAELVSNSRELETKRLRNLQDYFIKKVKKEISKVQFNGDLKKRLPNNINMRIPGVTGQEVIIKLDLDGFAVSPGAACSARVCKPSQVLRAMGFSDERAINSIRVTFGRQTDRQNIDKLLKSIKNNLNTIS